MTKRELLKALVPFSDDIEIVAELQGNTYKFQLVSIGKPYLRLKCQKSKSDVVYKGEKYDVDSICESLPAATVEMYPTKYDCAADNVAQYASINCEEEDDDYYRDVTRLADYIPLDVYERVDKIHDGVTQCSGCYIDDVASHVLGRADEKLDQLLLTDGCNIDALYKFFHEYYDVKYTALYTYLTACLCYHELLSLSGGKYLVGKIRTPYYGDVNVYSEYYAPRHICGLLEENEAYLKNCCAILGIEYTDGLAWDTVRGDGDVIKELVNAEDLFYKLWYNNKCTKEMLARICYETIGVPTHDILVAVESDSGIAGKLQDAMSTYTKSAGLYAYVFTCLYYWEVLSLSAGKQRVGIVRTVKGEFVEVYKNEEVW